MSVPESSSVVSAHILDAMDLAIDFDQDDESFVDFEGLRLGWTDLLPGANVMKFRHLGCFFHSYCRTWRAMAAPRASRTLWIVMRSKICWKNPVTIIRIASDRVNPRDWA